MPNQYCPPAGVLFPSGHVVSDDQPLHVRYLYSVPSIAKFESDLDFLCRRYRPLPLSELEQLPERRAARTTASAFVLSFDDGMREAYDVIAPMLRAKGIPAIFFINSATIDNRQMMWRNKISLLIEQAQKQPGRIPPQISVQPGEGLPAKLRALRFSDGQLIDEVAKFFEIDFDEYLRRNQPYLTSSQVQEMSRNGFEIGAHSDRHPPFQQLTLDEQEREISASVNFIRELRAPCRYFAFPFHDGGVPTSVFRYMADLGVALSFGTSAARLDPVAFSFQRFALDAENANVSIPEILNELSVKSLARRWSRTEMIHRN
jgi:peptidoglycan/xylan/chitin deacetylase (PgdA/CDA1 family)